MNEKELQNFLERSMPEPNSGCWLWTGGHTTRGYGFLNVVKPDGIRRTALAHRLAYEHWIGAIPDGLVLDHLCKNPACCNPHHVEPVTQKVNINRGDGYNKNKTHCPQGHAYEGRNLINLPGERGAHRLCRACINERSLTKNLPPERLAAKREYTRRYMKEKRARLKAGPPNPSTLQ